MLSKVKSLLGFQPQVLVDTETTAPNVFSYSLYYVYYDQYTYISGVFVEDIMIAIAGIIFALQVCYYLSYCCRF